MTSDGSLYGFGRNQNGQLGLGNSTDAVQPVLIQGMKVHCLILKNLALVAASHSMPHFCTICCLICTLCYTHKLCLLSACVPAAFGVLVSLAVALLLLQYCSTWVVGQGWVKWCKVGWGEVG